MTASEEKGRDERLKLAKKNDYGNGYLHSATKHMAVPNAI